jgi:hypothetical protein
MEFRNSEVIKGNLPEWLPFIERHYGVFSEELRTKLLTISASTMKRYFKRAREVEGGGRNYQRLGRALFCELKYRYAQLPFGPVPLVPVPLVHSRFDPEELPINRALQLYRNC